MFQSYVQSFFKVKKGILYDFFMTTMGLGNST